MRYYGNLARDAIQDGMTVEEFAEKAGIPVGMVEHYLAADGVSIEEQD